MKKKILGLSFLLLFVYNLSQAQERFQGSLVGGVVLAQLDGDRLAGFNKFGFQAGAKVNTILTDRWSLGIELLYSQHGSSRTLDDGPAAVFEKINLNLVEAPLMIYFKDWKFELGAGLSYGRLINYSATDVFGEDVTDTQDYATDHAILNIGVGFNFTENWTLDVRWSRYLTNIQADPGAGTFIGKNIAVRGIYNL